MYQSCSVCIRAAEQTPLEACPLDRRTPAGYERWGDMEKAKAIFEDMKAAGLPEKGHGGASAKIPSYLEQFSRKLLRTNVSSCCSPCPTPCCLLLAGRKSLSLVGLEHQREKVPCHTLVSRTAAPAGHFWRRGPALKRR